MEKRKIITEYYNIRKQLIDLQRQQVVQKRDQEIEEKFSIFLTGKPKVKSLKRKLYTNYQKLA